MGAPPFQPQSTVKSSDESVPFPPPAVSGAEPAHSADAPSLDLHGALTVPAIPWPHARPGKCYQNVNQFVIERGGSFACGWALADCGPMIRSNLGAKPLYYRWIHHLIWEDCDHRLWEVTPYYDVQKHEDIAWAPTAFILDRATIPHINAQGFCVMQPARYVATRAEGLDVAKCLNALERDGSRYETYWLQQAVQALQQIGFETVEWHVERIDGRINNVWLFAN
jgi:hypothetical protein